MEETTEQLGLTSKRVLSLHYMQTRVVGPLSRFSEPLDKKLREMLNRPWITEVHELHVRPIAGNALDVEISYLVDNAVNIPRLTKLTTLSLERAAFETCKEQLPGANPSHSPRYFQIYDPSVVQPKV